jgi:N-acetylglucosamine malate deacetylase 1
LQCLLKIVSLNPYPHFVSEYARLAQEGKGWPLGGFPKCPRPAVAPDAPKILIFAPHPDDEVIIGGLALRLLREAKWNVINVAVTQGSSKTRQAERWKELKECCDCIGFGLLPTAPNGLEKVNVACRQQEPARWAQSVQVIADILATHQPRAILFPHDDDWNSSHIGTHHLVVDALKTLPGFECFAVETEFWGAMQTPNLMVEVSAPDLGDLITALTFHVGEVKRNPYHLSLPAWMIDNVRRGGEVVGGQGGAAPDFTFATLYRLRRWQQGTFQPVLEKGRALSQRESAAALFA